MLVNGINTLFNLYFFIIILRIFLSWIPSIDWESEPFNTVRVICDSYLDIFRKFIPPAGGLDFSPIIALIVLQIIQRVVIFTMLKFM